MNLKNIRENGEDIMNVVDALYGRIEDVFLYELFKLSKMLSDNVFKPFQLGDATFQLGDAVIHGATRLSC
jgi:hypothetical protein